MAGKLKTAVIGLGIIGSQHAECLKQHPEVDLVAVADVRAEVAAKAAARLATKAYTDYYAMLREQALDLVIVATPDPYHRDPSVAALEAGVPNIIQEKPMATTLEDALAIYEAVEKHKARFFIDFSNRVMPLDTATRYIIQHGLLGEVVYADCRVDDNITVPTRMWGTRSQEWAASSSSAHFLLSHIVDLLRWYFAPAEVKEVYATMQRRILGYTPDLYDAYLTFDSGLKARVKAEWTKHIDELVEFYVCLSGAEGTLIYNKLASFGTQAGWRANLPSRVSAQELLAHQEALLAQGTNVAILLHRPDPSTGYLSAGGGELMPALEFRGACLGAPTAMLRYFIAAIQQGTLTLSNASHLGPLPNHVDGLRQAQVVTAIVESAEMGKVVSIA